MWEDVRYSVRALARHRGMVLVAVMSLALGVGANTTIFTLLNAVLLRTLPVEHPERLYALQTVDARNPGFVLNSYLNYRDYRDHNDVFSSLLAHTPLTVNLTGRGEPRLLMAQIVSGNYFTTLGVIPVLGRGFLPEEDATPGSHPVAVVSHAFWTSQLGADPQVTSRSLTLNGRPFRIVGVAPPAFQGLDHLYAADLWVPLMMYRQIYPNPAWIEQRRALILGAVGRLKPAVTVAQAQASLQTIAGDLERRYPRDNSGRRVRLSPINQALLSPRTRTMVIGAGTVLMIVSGLVVLIACANVANLLFARALGRNREISLRLALGAGRGRLIRQLLTENLLLSLLGGGAGLLLAAAARNLVWSLRPPMFSRAGLHLDLDARVLTYSLLVSVGTGLVFGLAPAFRATSACLATDLKERTGSAAPRFGAWNLRALMVSAQVAFSVIALIGAGLFLRSIVNAGRLDLGFDAARLGAVVFFAGDLGYTEARGREFQNRALELAASTPGVLAAAISKDGALRVSGARTVLLDGQDAGMPGAGRLTLTSVVSPGYFDTLRIPLDRGRDFHARDESGARRVAILNQAAAAQFWPGQDPIGKQLRFFGDPVPADVIGVARNAAIQSIAEKPQPLVYLSLSQYHFPNAVLFVRTESDPEAVALTVRRRIQTLDPNLLLQSESVHRTIRDSLWAQRLSAGLLFVFGILALLLAMIGIYGVFSYSVGQRVREIGVRMALGATVGGVQRMILGEAFRMVGSGILAGLLLAFAAARPLETMLFGIRARDPLTFFLVPATLAAVAALACWIPTRRATRIDPASALREE